MGLATGFPSNAPTSLPKAYLRMIFYNEDQTVVSDLSDFLENTKNSFHALEILNQTVQQSGYVRIFVANESESEVWFDNLQITHVQAPIVQENHYDPWGLNLVGIETQGNPNDKFQFVGQEKSDEFGLNWYSFRFREYDPQLARFISVDPLADKFVHNSVYAYAENKPVNGIDLEGLEYVNVNAIGGVGSDNYRLLRNGYGKEEVKYNGQIYLNVGTHLYQDKSGNIIWKETEGSTKITEWIYKTIDQVIPDSDYIAYIKGDPNFGDCKQCTDAQLDKAGVKPDSYFNSFQMYKEGKDGLPVTKESKEMALDIIHKNLEAGLPVEVGISYTKGLGRNHDKSTDHFVVIVSRGEDVEGKFFNFFENAVGNPHSGTALKNRLTLQADGTLTGTTTWYAIDPKTKRHIPLTYQVTHVRPNISNK
ncbi:RHS repeat domain-containing protein [Xanthocytophaga flava]|uniref:RHS repeat domain-containing protein n=1 Tax=Xanthocytophaga flava TaxID=3048013 RepID=UPI0028D190C9|nr:RHS repeat-associated core domain-containing protein [Xanthocytophaga flavus]MDJ1470199.1 RHS repeat-associated core domain-containing protein [Xanthocytophaga flavus]